MLTIKRLLRPAAATMLGCSMLWAGSTLASGLDTTNVRFIDSWSSVGPRTLIIHSLGHDYRAELQPGCSDIEFSFGLRFIPAGHFNEEFDRFGHIQLSDGTRCYLKSFEEVPRAKRQG